jgi:hypothetical protein
MYVQMIFFFDHEHGNVFFGLIVENVFFLGINVEQGAGIIFFCFFLV